MPYKVIITVNGLPPVWHETFNWAMVYLLSIWPPGINLIEDVYIFFSRKRIGDVVRRMPFNCFGRIVLNYHFVGSYEIWGSPSSPEIDLLSNCQEQMHYQIATMIEGVSVYIPDYL